MQRYDIFLNNKNIFFRKENAFKIQKIDNRIWPIFNVKILDELGQEKRLTLYKMKLNKLKEKIFHSFYYVFGLKKSEVSALSQMSLVLLGSLVLFKLNKIYWDLQKVHFIQEVLDQPLASLPQPSFKSKGSYYRNAHYYNNKDSFPEKKLIQKLDINIADSAAWETLPGIGPSFAKRIVVFRDRLGGFYSMNQLKEVYGLDSLWLGKNRNYLLNEKGIYRTIKINLVDYQGMRHPYIPYKQINLVLNFRQAHGDFHSFDDLKQIKLLDSLQWNRVKPYLSFESSKK